MLEESSLEQLKNKKNLLAFSGGGDSTALFFLLLEKHISFDIAIVDYSVREQSKLEVAYAHTLASQHKIKCHLLKAPQYKKNFEASARASRYNFFEELIEQYNYTNLLTAHHLGDRLEWMLMQFCKGAGCVEMAGMQTMEQRGTYTLIRPLLHLTKEELLHYLHLNNIKYFEDETNLDQSLARNSFRHKIATPLLKEFKEGIKKSFQYIDEDKKELIEDIQIHTLGEISYFTNTHKARTNIYLIDKHLKTLGFMMSAQERKLLKTNETVVLGRKYLIWQHESYVFTAPYSHETPKMAKKFKEECRVLKIEPKFRAFFYKNPQIFLKVKALLHHSL